MPESANPTDKLAAGVAPASASDGITFTPNDELHPHSTANSRRTRYNHLVVGLPGSDGPNPRGIELDDPWIKVGTTTIDGTAGEVDALLSDANIVDDDVFLVGGRYLRPNVTRSSAVGARIVFCDIVRRQSEIDAELVAEAESAATINACVRCGDDSRLLSTEGWCDPCCDRAANPCPECGPHGNAGKVQLAERWVACTTCAGGQPGDAFGPVESPTGALSLEQIRESLKHTPLVLTRDDAYTFGPGDIPGEDFGKLYLEAVDQVAATYGRTRDDVLQQLERLDAQLDQLAEARAALRATKPAEFVVTRMGPAVDVHIEAPPQPHPLFGPGVAARLQQLASSVQRARDFELAAELATLQVDPARAAVDAERQADSGPHDPSRGVTREALLDYAAKCQRIAAQQHMRMAADMAGIPHHLLYGPKPR